MPNLDPFSVLLPLCCLGAFWDISSGAQKMLQKGRQIGREERKRHTEKEWTYLSNMHTTNYIPTQLANAAHVRSWSTYAGVRHSGGLHLPVVLPPVVQLAAVHVPDRVASILGGPSPIPWEDPRVPRLPCGKGWSARVLGSIEPTTEHPPCVGGHAPEHANSTCVCLTLGWRQSQQPAEPAAAEHPGALSHLLPMLYSYSELIFHAS